MDLPAPPPHDPLAQPTRARLFALLRQWHRAASTDELAAALNRHPNGVRGHLEQLHAAGLVVRTHVRLPRGRPRDAWSIDPNAAPGGAPPTAYAQLAQWLVQAIAAVPAAADQLRDAGHTVGRNLAATSPAAGTTEEQFFDLLSAMGMQPERTESDGTQQQYRLRNCPYRDAARDHQAVVCGLHRAITRGALERLDEHAQLTAFEPQSPDRAGCLLAITGGQTTVSAVTGRASDAEPR